MLFGLAIVFALLAVIPLVVWRYNDKLSPSAESALKQLGVGVGFVAGALAALALLPVLWAWTAWAALFELAAIAVTLIYLVQWHHQRQIDAARAFENWPREDAAIIELSAGAESIVPMQHALHEAASSGAAITISHVVGLEAGNVSPTGQTYTSTSPDNAERWQRLLRNSLGDGAQIRGVSEEEDPVRQLAKQLAGEAPAKPIEIHA